MTIRTCEFCEPRTAACSFEESGGSKPDLINHPPHYTSHKSGVECIQVTEHMSFCLGNALKYIWRADEKGNALDDLRKARWYIDRELARREGAAEPAVAEADPELYGPGVVAGLCAGCSRAIVWPEAFSYMSGKHYHVACRPDRRKA